MTVAVQDLHKSFGGEPALAGLSLTIESGQIHALVGPNGAGKSTLIKCLSGVITPDTGTMALDGSPLLEMTPQKAVAAGIATVYQNLSLVGELTVAENIFLGSELAYHGIVRRREQEQIAAGLLDRFGISVDPTVAVGRLPVGVRQLIEIAKAWHRVQVRLLILDEPTAALTRPEVDRLFQELRSLRAHGVRILYTTHRLAEVFEIGDWVTAVRDGRVTRSADVASITGSDLVRAIAGNRAAEVGSRPMSLGREVLVLESLQGKRFGPVSVRLRAGEVLAIYGLLGSGRSSLLESVAGRWPLSSGTVAVDGKGVLFRSPNDAISRGVALVPSDRLRQALFSTLSAKDNMLLPLLGRLGRLGVRNRRSEARTFETNGDALDLHPRDPQRRASAYSGGNQQKLVLGRWVSEASAIRVLLLDEPTQGVDVGAREDIYAILRRMARQRGIAVLFASSDPEEVAALADRALVLEDGRVVAELKGENVTEAALVALAGGVPVAVDNSSGRPSSGTTQYPRRRGPADLSGGAII